MKPCECNEPLVLTREKKLSWGDAVAKATTKERCVFGYRDGIGGENPTSCLRRFHRWGESMATVLL